MTKKFRVALLDDRSVLVGCKTKAKLGKDDVDIGDLPADGTYRYDPDVGQFWPVGKGHGKPERPPIPDHKALYLLAKDSVDPGVKRWVEWYEQTMERV